MPNAVVSDPVANPQEQAPLFSTAKLLEEWRATCRTFLSWEKERILLGKPTAEERDKHRRTLTWLLRMTRLLDGLLSDPEFPDRSAAGRLKPPCSSSSMLRGRRFTTRSPNRSTAGSSPNASPRMNPELLALIEAFESLREAPAA